MYTKMMFEVKTHALVIALYRSCPAIKQESGRQIFAHKFRNTGIPNLRFQSLSIHLNAPCRKLDSNCTLGLQIEFVSSKSREKV
mmetsp:Transcript_41342/g.110627  ORF Transcript_41342/g.110627 Transcript_41342/m.110627 type:complete len:84 (-) Transcript_41342:190-441(-)